MLSKNNVLCFLGDSITEGVGTTKVYFEYIAGATGAEVHGFGVNGAPTMGLFAQMERMDREVGGAFDTLFVLIGTNDYNAGVPIGTFFTEHTVEVGCDSDAAGEFTAYATRRKREFVMDEGAFCGRLNMVFSALRHRYADKRILLLTPLHRAYAYFGGANIQPDELHTNRAGVYFEEYIHALREAADIWSLELIDLYRDAGLFPLYDESGNRYFHDGITDRLHPNAEGHRRIAETILNKA